jgi:phytoene dehydrogenase-like protein
MSKKVVIIGAGMAGLSAGIHLRRNGYDTLILEAHSIPGGLVTAWKRKNYNFDGCVHWIPGCSEKDGLYCVNDEIFDMGKLEIIRHETIFDIECLHSSAPDGSRFFPMYSGADRLEEYLLKISPDDSEVIREYTGMVRSIAKYNLPPTLKPEKLMSIADKLGMIRHLPLLLSIKKASKYSVKEFASRFSSPFLKEAFERMSFGREYPILVLAMRNVFGQKQSSGYPKGGSAKLAELAAERYKALGGEIRYNSPVKSILVEAGKAKGVILADGKEVRADIVISAADGHWTLYEALQGKYLTPDLKELYEGKKLEIFESNVFISLGIRRKLDSLPNEMFFSFEEARKLCDGSVHPGIQAHIMNYDPSLAPEGCTVINTMLTT